MTQYEDEMLIGTGGFGEVWSCIRNSDGQCFAKKKLADGVGEDAIERFQREVRILSKLDHPNVMKVVAKHLTEPPYWYVMPLYQHSMEAVLPLLRQDDRRARSVFTAVLDAIEYAHGEGVIHRDLKCANVLMNGDADVVVSDFGLGRMIDATSTRQTVTGWGLGTAFYMAPEQFADAKRADERSDIYSLGRVLYELYAEPLSFTAMDLTLLRPALATIVGRSTQRDPRLRYESVTDLKRAWAGALLVADTSSNLSDVTRLRNLLSDAYGVTQADVANFVELLWQVQVDDDYVHDMLIELRPEAVELMLRIDPHLTRRLVLRFVTFTSEGSWGFSYTDVIGDTCVALYHRLQDAEIRAALLVCLLMVGYGHNRWQVMGQFAELVAGPKLPYEGRLFAQQVQARGAMHHLLEAAQRVNRADLDPSIREVVVLAQQPHRD